MTIKELADVAGVTTRTINRVAKTYFSEMIEKGKIAEFDKDQSIKILQAVKKKNFVEPRQSVNEPRQSVNVEKVDPIDFARAIIEAYKQGLNESKQITSPPALPEPRADYMTALAWCIKTGLSTSPEYLRKFGKVASRLCREQGMLIKQIQDEKYHMINSYPVDVLEYVYKYV